MKTRTLASISPYQYWNSKPVDPKMVSLEADHNRTLPEESKPVQVPQMIKVARKPKAAAPINGETNGANGTTTTNGTGTKRKRSRSPEEPSIHEQPSSKAAKIQKSSDADDLIVLDDSGNGAIVIDD